jgi:hypothetical protein
MRKVFRFIGKSIQIVLRVLYLWYWIIPLNLGLLALVGYFGLIYLLFGTISMSEINEIVGKSGSAFFWQFWLPFAIPIFMSLGSTLYRSDGVKKQSLNEAIRFRNGQMKVKSDKEASEILRKTNYLDMLQKNDSEVFDKARRGFDAKCRTKPANEIFNDIMNKDENA